MSENTTTIWEHSAVTVETVMNGVIMAIEKKAAEIEATIPSFKNLDDRAEFEDIANDKIALLADLKTRFESYKAKTAAEIRSQGEKSLISQLFNI